MNELIRRLRYLLRRGDRDRELAGELEFHREMAAREGRTNLGNPLRLREESRDAWGWTWLDRFSQDLRYATRQLVNAPGFALTAVLMLALGIGVNVAAFGFFNLILFRALPVRDPDSLLSFQRRSPEAYASAVPYPAMVFYRDHTRTLSAVFALQATTLAQENVAQPARVHFVSANTFTDLGAPMALGRPLDPIRDEATGAEAVAVLSYGYWQRQYGSSVNVLGRVIRLNRQTATIVGVAGASFGGLTMNGNDLWLAITQQPRFVAGSQLFSSFDAEQPGVEMWGRLRPGLTPKAAEDDLAQLAVELRKSHPKEMWENERLASGPGGYVKLNGGGQRGTGTPVSERQKLLPIFILVGSLVLLILAVACANLGSLLLARGVARQREMAIRVWIGAGSGRLVRQLFTESLLLAMVGAGVGLGLGILVLRGLLIWTGAPEWLDPAPDWRVLLFAVGAGLAAALMFGLAPALQIGRQRQQVGSQREGANRLRQILIGAQVAASCVLLIVAGLLVRGLQQAVSMDPGFAYERVVSIAPSLADHGFTAPQSRAYLDRLLARLRALPGIESAALVASAPLGNRSNVMRVKIDERQMDVHVNHVDRHYFETMKIPLLRGRAMGVGEKAVVISESMARFQWPSEDPLGKAFPNDEAYPIVGIAASARTGALNDPDAGEAYFPIGEADWPGLLVIVRCAGAPEAMLPPIAGLAKSLDAQLFPSVQTMKVAFGRKLESTQRSAAAVSVLGATALGLACLGIMGLVSYTVSQRTKEIGIRLALGARPGHVLRAILMQFSRPILIGLGLGVAGAAGLSQLLRRELYGVSHLDPWAYLAAVAVFVVMAAAASLWPARRAIRIDPLRALRYE